MGGTPRHLRRHGRAGWPANACIACTQVPLDADGLDACCLDDTTFVKAYAGFQLVRNSDAQTVPKRSAGAPGENVSPNASRVAKKAREA